MANASMTLTRPENRAEAARALVECLAKLTTLGMDRLSEDIAIAVLESDRKVYKLMDAHVSVEIACAQKG